ncbi:hypothetical protein [Burkholderia gladioli]|uniref:hypothetical protein n=1 Tax=Burkholderia gladioli TaxID=28095 RepID=UPI00164124CF|nr:hypothetical protein [Burkholderia gladioli]
MPSSGSKKTSTTDVLTDAVAPRIRVVLPSRWMTVIPARTAADSASTVGAFMANTFRFGNRDEIAKASKIVEVPAFGKEPTVFVY